MPHEILSTRARQSNCKNQDNFFFLPDPRAVTILSHYNRRRTRHLLFSESEREEEDPPKKTNPTKKPRKPGNSAPPNHQSWPEETHAFLGTISILTGSHLLPVGGAFQVATTLAAVYLSLFQPSPLPTPLDTAPWKPQQKH
jgi:hypothetical protein